MKTRFLLAMAALSLAINSAGQKTLLKLTFSATWNNIRVQLDSIRVTNVTQGGDTVLFWPDTILMLGNEVGLPDAVLKSGGLKMYQNFPNPCGGQTFIKVEVPEKGSINLLVTDLLGRKILGLEKVLEKGRHSFRFTPARSEVYFFTARWKGNTQTIRILSDNISNQSPALDYAGAESPGEGLKSHTAAPALVFEPGDSLYYIGYVHLADEIIASNVLTDTPEGDSTYYFQMTEGTPCPDIPAFIYQNHLYETVRIGTQCWLKENLQNTSYRNGDPIQNVTDDATWYALQEGAYCNYDNNESNGNIYGRLYNGYAVLDNRCLCPEGWHVATHYEDFVTLVNHYGGNAGIIGGYMKATGVLWNYPNEGADNRSGFTALPGGSRFDWNGSYHFIGEQAVFWTSTVVIPGALGAHWLYFNKIALDGGTDAFYTGHSVRCVKDQ